MALTATLLRFDIELSDVDRGVYESFELKVAQHPSEDTVRVIVRVLARCLSHEEGLDFGRGLSTVEDPTLCVRGAGDEVKLWIDVGAPSAERLHKASKHAERVVVYTEKDDNALTRAFSGKVHQAEKIEVVRLGRAFVDEVVASVARKQSWTLTRIDGALTLTSGDKVFTDEPVTTSVASFHPA